MRMTGRTTRIADEAIQQLFTTGIINLGFSRGGPNIFDHHGSAGAQRDLFRRIVRRLEFEHGLKYNESIVVNKKDMIIEIKIIKR